MKGRGSIIFPTPASAEFAFSFPRITFLQKHSCLCLQQNAKIHKTWQFILRVYTYPWHPMLNAFIFIPIFLFSLPGYKLQIQPQNVTCIWIVKNERKFKCSLLSWRSKRRRHIAVFLRIKLLIIIYVLQLQWYHHCWQFGWIWICCYAPRCRIAENTLHINILRLIK